MNKNFSFVFLEPGDKVLVVHRRLFEKDKARFFIGSVDGFHAGMIKVTGFSFCESASGKRFLKKKDARTKILSLTSGTLMVYQLPSQTNVAMVRLGYDDKDQLWLTDGQLIKMDLSETSPLD